MTGSEFAAAEVAVQAALDAGAWHAEARLVARRAQSLTARDGEIVDVADREEVGVGVRALVGGGWGFAATSDTSVAALAAAGREAAAIGAALAGTPARPTRLVDAPVAHGTWTGDYVEDPFAVTPTAKGDLLVTVTRELRAAGVDLATAVCRAWDTAQWFVSSTGHRIHQRTRECGAGMSATATGPDGSQRRSHPAARGQYGAGGWERVTALDLIGQTARVADEARALTTAPPCPAAETTLVVGSEQVAVQLHETVGHAVELDRILGWEAGFAGTSWLELDRLGSLRLGSPLLTVVADPTVAGALGGFGYDDEGTPAGPRDLVRNGVWVGVLAGRDSAAQAGLDHGGSVRGDGHEGLPMVRITGVHLAEGDQSLEQMIAETDNGVYVEGNRSWSIDDRRRRFQFGCEIGWEIRHGRLGRMVRNPTYRGDGADIWHRLDRLGSASTVWGVPHCGKGQPLQVGHCSHRTPAARFTGVEGRALPRRRGDGAVSTDALARELLDRVARAAGARAEIAVAVHTRRHALARFADSAVHQHVASHTRTVRLTVHLDGRTAVCTTTRTDPGSLPTFAAHAVDLVRSAPADPGWPGLAGRSGPAGTAVDGAGNCDDCNDCNDCEHGDAAGNDGDHGDHRDPGEVAARVRAVAAFVDGAGDARCAGFVGVERLGVHHVDSAGGARSGSSTQGVLDAVARTDTTAGLGRRGARRLADIDAHALGVRAGADARACRDPIDLPGGSYEVVLAPTAAADVVGAVAAFGFNALATVESRSCVRLGAAQWDPHLTVVDSRRRSGTPGLPLDADGTPRRDVELIDAGTSVALTHDRRTAAVLGARSTGHALDVDGFGPVALNLTMAPGHDDPDALVAGVRRGLLVTDHWYTRPVDPTSLTFAGVTRNGVWWIEDGERGPAVADLRFTQSYAEALAPGHVAAVGSDLTPLPGDVPMSGYLLPSLHLTSWNFHGRS